LILLLRDIIKHLRTGNSWGLFATASSKIGAYFVSEVITRLSRRRFWDSSNWCSDSCHVINLGAADYFIFSTPIDRRPQQFHSRICS